MGSPTRRWFLQAGLTGFAGLSLAQLMQLQRQARAATPSPSGDPKSVILFWLSGGPSHLDMWDPEARRARGDPRAVRHRSRPRVPGVRFCEHLPRQAAIMDKLTVIRSVDCSASNHTPITMQAGNPLARRTDDGRDGGGYPSMGSIAAKFRGPNDPTLPAFVGLADSWTADVWGAGAHGRGLRAGQGERAAGRFALPPGVDVDRLRDRDGAAPAVRPAPRATSTPAAIEDARPLHAGGPSRWSPRARRGGRSSSTRKTRRLRDAYGRDSLGEKALLARRLVEAGVTFVLVSGAWGYFDHHGDNVVWGGIEKGLKPLLPRVDQALATLVDDLEARGLLDSTLVLMMGEFGRAPAINRDAGREHWTNVMSMVLAGGGLRHGQVIGATDRKGYGIVERKVDPAGPGGHRLPPPGHRPRRPLGQPPGPADPDRRRGRPADRRAVLI